MRGRPEGPSSHPERSEGSRLSRRSALKVLGTAAGGLAAGPLAEGCAPAKAPNAADSTKAVAAAAPKAPPGFFTPHERQTVDVLVDYIIPRDERSGSATEAGVPAWMDGFLADADTEDAFRANIRGGLGWLDAECVRRFGLPFVGAADAQRREVLDAVAYPARAEKRLSHGVLFFNRIRDLTASGFWSSRAGHADLRYTGNVAVPAWDGCPAEVVSRLGVSYDLMATRVPPQGGRRA